ncbi:hypothetical protein KO361_01450 [Candidatus Woesearchaeota archaeon]|nr:hypothetical protein [Candidatus Woesearchaeota archaeon]
MVCKKKKKGQAALEFLMTYGWAFLVILIVIGAFVYFDVLNPAKLIPPRCSFPAGFTCDEFAVKDDGVEFTIVNRLGYTIDGFNAVLIDLNNPDAEISCTSDPDTGNRVIDGGRITFTCDENFEYVSGERFQSDIIVKYTRAGGNIEQQSRGSLGAEVQQ